MWQWVGRRPARPVTTRWLTNPWLLSALGVAAASVVGMRMWRRT